MNEQEFNINKQDYNIISASKERILLINLKNGELYEVSPKSIKGKVNGIYEGLKLTIDDRLSRELIKGLESPIYFNDRPMTWGEAYDIMTSQTIRINELESQLKEEQGE